MILKSVNISENNMRKWNLFTAIFQTIVGIAAIIAYIFVAAMGEPLGKWTITLILAIAFLVIAPSLRCGTRAFYRHLTFLFDFT